MFVLGLQNGWIIVFRLNLSTGLSSLMFPHIDLSLEIDNYFNLMNYLSKIQIITNNILINIFTSVNSNLPMLQTKNKLPLTVIILSLLLLANHCLAQNLCSIIQLPSTIPISINQSFYLNMDEYIRGSNLTLSLASPNEDSGISLKNKYEEIQRKEYQLGKILSISINKRNDTFSFLGESVQPIDRKYYIYYGKYQKISEQVSAIDIPPQMGNCSTHQMNSKQQLVVIGKKFHELNLNETIFTIGMLDIHQQKWTIRSSAAYVQSYKQQILYISDTVIAVIVYNNSNSYIELWNTKYGQILGVYDRSYFTRDTLNIVDAQSQNRKLYILEYQIGLIELGLDFERLIVIRKENYYRYQNIIVMNEATILAKSGTLIEKRKQSIIKYEDFMYEGIQSLQANSFFIVTYFSNNHLMVYKRGMMQPYLILSFEQYQYVQGLFANDEELLQVISPRSQKSKAISIIVSILEITPSILSVKPFSAQKQSQEVQVHIRGQAKMNQKIDICESNFTLKIVNSQDETIYPTKLHEFTKIFMNRPGRTQLKLDQYGMGPNINYTAEPFQSNLNITTKIHKITQPQISVLQGMEKTLIQGIYTAENCFHVKCPLIIDSSSQNSMKYFTCETLFDLYEKKGINCTEQYREYKFGEYLHYQVEYAQELTYGFYELSVGEAHKDQILIRKFQQLSKKLNDSVLIRYRLEGDNKYGQNNISCIYFDINNKMVIVLLKAKKQIQIYSIQESTEKIQLALIKRINRESIYIERNHQEESIEYFSPQSFEIDSKKNLWVKSFDQILIIDFTYSQIAQRSQILQIYDLSSELSQLISYDFIISKNDQVKEESLINQYLVIASSPSLLIFKGINDDYEPVSEFKKLPLYGMEIPSIQAGAIKLKDKLFAEIDMFKISVVLLDPRNNQTKIQIYSLDQYSISLTSYLQVSTVHNRRQNIGQALTFPIYLSKKSYNPFLLVFSLQLSNLTTKISPYLIFKNPSLSIIIPNSPSLLKQDKIILDVFNKQKLLREFLTIQLSNYPETLGKGELYPYKRIRKEASDREIILDTRGWLSGNVIQNTFTCKICRESEPHDPSEAWIEARPKIELKMSFNGLNPDYFLPTNESLNQVILIKNNLVYLLNLKTGNISSSFQIALNAEYQIKQIKLNWQLNLGIALCARNSGQITINTFSMNSFKGFILSQAFLPEQASYIRNLEYKNNLIAVTQLNGVYLYLMNTLGQTKEIAFIGENEAGGVVCWTELIEISPEQFMLMITLCEYGVTIYRLQIQEEDLKILSKQIIDFSAILKEHSIKIPNDASFQRTLTIQNKFGYLVLAVINKFNSVQFQFYSSSTSIITKVTVFAMIHRYGDFLVTDQVDIEPINHRYLKIVYTGVIFNQASYITAVYDLSDLQKLESQATDFFHCYIMETLISTNSQPSKYVGRETLMVLQKKKQSNFVSIYNTSNAFRASIHSYQEVYTQPLFIISKTPTSSFIVELQLHGIDIIEWETWEIWLTAIAGIALFILISFGCKTGYEEYARRKKLVPLLVDYPEFQEDLDEERSMEKGMDKDSMQEQDLFQQQKIDHQGNGINYSIRGSSDP